MQTHLLNPFLPGFFLGVIANLTESLKLHLHFSNKKVLKGVTSLFGDGFIKHKRQY